MLWRLYRAEVALKGEGSGREDRHGWVDVDFARWDSKLRDWSSLPMDGESDGSADYFPSILSVSCIYCILLS